MALAQNTELSAIDKLFNYATTGLQSYSSFLDAQTVRKLQLMQNDTQQYVTTQQDFDTREAVVEDKTKKNLIFYGGAAISVVAIGAFLFAWLRKK